MTEKELAIKIRRILLSAVDLIELYYKLGKHAAHEIQEVEANDSLTSDLMI